LKTKVICGIIFIFIVIFITGCHFADVSNNSQINAQTLAGDWASSIITYPDDPIFKNYPPITKPGSIGLLLQHNGHFVFIWDDTNVSGTYHVNGQNLVFSSQKEKEVIECLFELKGKYLTIKMPDGFNFKFIKNSSKLK
jgi:hypothetical protein